MNTFNSMRNGERQKKTLPIPETEMPTSWVDHEFDRPYKDVAEFQRLHEALVRQDADFGI